jgi:D-3-phosphoglycerate dehydrogenase / 2-oxoglutarate reductase
VKDRGRTNTILITDHPAPDVGIEAAVLAAVGGRLLVAQTGTEAELLELAPGADAIMTCFAQVTPSVVEAAPHLKVIGRYGVGVDNIAVNTASDRGVIVANVPAYCVDEVAEHAIALLLSLARRITRYDNAVRTGNWALATGMPIHRLSGRSLGIVGFGRIGRAVAARGKALGMRVMAFDPRAADETFRSQLVQRASLDELLSESDFVSLHTPLTPETHHLIDWDALNKMKPTSFVINTSRGGVIDLVALERALKSGVIAGAGLDVFEPERLPQDHPLLSVDSVVVTPHVGFYSEESIGDLQRLAAQNVAAVFEGRAPMSVVNPLVLQLPRWAELDKTKP